MSLPERLAVIDSHTEGEPTRVVLEGGNRLPGATMAERRAALRRGHDDLRQALLREPRGNEALVGALLTPPVAAGSLAGVIFFDNAGYLGMCGHGTIGVVRTLDFLGRLPEPERAGEAVSVRLDTPAGTVVAAAERGVADGPVTITNVPARCVAQDVTVDVPGIGRVSGDVAYGGNWFFLVEIDQLPGLRMVPDDMPRLRAATLAIRQALAAAGVRGDDGEKDGVGGGGGAKKGGGADGGGDGSGGGSEIDHIEVLTHEARGESDSVNYVLCPSGTHDRSPCGTGTSAHLAALAARGKLAIGQRWRQQSLTGGRFTGWLSGGAGGELVPHIQGRAFITGQTTLIFQAADPFRGGLPASWG